MQEIVVINQARILRAPEILDALLENPNLTADVRRRALETREEFFDKKARARRAGAGRVDEDEPMLTLSEDADRRPAGKGGGEEPGDGAAAGAHGVGEDGREEAVHLLRRSWLMSVSEKVSSRSKAARPSG